MQKFLTPDLKHKLRQAIPYTIVTVIVCAFMLILTSGFSYEMYKIREEIHESYVRNHEINERIDAMGARIDNTYQVLLMMNGKEKQAVK